MKWFYNLKTAVKLSSAFIIVSIILAGVGIYGLSNSNKLNNEITSMYDDRLVPIRDLSDVQNLYQRNRVNIRDMIDASTKTDKDNYLENLKGNRKEIDAKVNTYSKTFLVEAEQEGLKKFTSVWEAYKKLVDQAVQLIFEGKDTEIKALLQGDLKKTGDELTDILKELIDVNVKVADKLKKDTDILYATSRTTTIIVIIFTLLICIGLGYFISQIISRPLNRVVKLVEKVADGDLRETIDIDMKDEVGQLAGSVNRMVENLRQLIGGVSSSSQNVAAASQQISASTEEIAGSSTSQANSAQTMTELFKELSVVTISVAQSAETAAELASETVKTAQEGGEIVKLSIEGMNKVSDQMSRLENDSNNIGEIIEVIDDIAEQTNLLALNAAIEAARAGEQGRGFAVVADEVRKLAERSSDATKQITAIIKGMQVNTQYSVKAVLDGVLQTQQTGEAFERIILMVNDSSHKVTEIAAASEEQAAQSTEVMKSIETISAASEESAAAAEETASSSQSLAQLAEELNNSVSIFKIN